MSKDLTVKISGHLADVLEIFEEYLVVQEIESKLIYTISLEELIFTQDDTCDKIESNIISLKGWSEWREKNKELKLQMCSRNLKRSLLKNNKPLKKVST